MKKSQNNLILVIGVTILVIIAVFLLMPGKKTQTEGTGSKELKPAGSAEFQVVRMKVNGMEYEPAECAVEKGKPVKFIVDGTNARGCVKYFIIPELDVNTMLKPGENIFEFIPEKEGEIAFSCSMGMARGKFKVVDRLSGYQPDRNNEENIYTGANFQLSVGNGLELNALPAAKNSFILEAKNGSVIDISADVVAKEINGKQYKMYGYNGMIPGPVLKVEKNSRIIIKFKNNIQMP